MRIVIPFNEILAKGAKSKDERRELLTRELVGQVRGHTEVHYERKEMTVYVNEREAVIAFGIIAKYVK